MSDKFSQETVAMLSQSQGMVDHITEGALFESWLVDHLMPTEYSGAFLFERDEDANYKRQFVSDAWDGWLARAIHGAKLQQAQAKLFKNAAPPTS